MTCDDVLQILREYRNEKQFDLGIVKLGLFGSVARGEQSGQSDIDVVVKLRDQDLLTLAGIKQELEIRLRSPVDVVSYRTGMNPALKNRIDRDVKWVGKKLPKRFGGCAMATLRRDSDGEGHYGTRIQAIDRVNKKIVGHEPMVGYCLLVGTMTAGTYSTRDWWRTTEITEIIESNEDKIRFKTVSGSTYTLYR